MVQLLSLVGAAALFSTSLAAPTVRRSQYEQKFDYQYEDAKFDDKNFDHKQVEQYHYTTTSAYHPVATYYDDKKFEQKFDDKFEQKYDNKVEHDQYKDVKFDDKKYDYQYEDNKFDDKFEDKFDDKNVDYKYEDDVKFDDKKNDFQYQDEYKWEEPKKNEWEYQDDYKWEEDKKAEEWQPAHTTDAWEAHPTYGSGSSEWGASYDDCVSQCAAKYPTPPSLHTPTVSQPVGNGVIHTVMVAPEAGVLRYYPFALNATVGDTVRYVWTTPANHTATLSSELAICNRSGLAEQRSFVSGIRNGQSEQSVFDVVVQTEEPQFFYCSVASHCEQGMWGIINPRSEFGGLNTVGAKMNEWVTSNPDLGAAWNVVHETTKGSSADTWGNTISLQGIPESAYTDVAANVIWTRANFGANPGSLELNQGAATPDGSPLKIVGDLSTLLSATNLDPNAAPAPNGSVTAEVPTASEAASNLASDARKNVAGLSVAVLVGLVTVALF